MKKRLFSLLLIAVLFVLPLTASADVSSSIPVQIQLEEPQLSLMVPSSINATIDSENDLTFPSASACKIVNGSPCPIKITNIACTAEEGWAIGEGTENTITVSVKPNSSTNELALIAGDNSITSNVTEWDLAKSNTTDTTDEIGLTFTGSVAALTKEITATPQTAFSIVFTFEAGSHTA